MPRYTVETYEYIPNSIENNVDLMDYSSNTPVMISSGHKFGEQMPMTVDFAVSAKPKTGYKLTHIVYKKDYRDNSVPWKSYQYTKSFGAGMSKEKDGARAIVIFTAYASGQFSEGILDVSKQSVQDELNHLVENFNTPAPIVDTVKYPITTSLHNATLDLTVSEVESGSSLTVIATANDGFHFNDINGTENDAFYRLGKPNSEYPVHVVYLKPEQNSKTFTFTIPDITEPLLISFWAHEDVAPTVTYTEKLVHAKSSLTGSSVITKGNNVSITFTADDGYEFSTARIASQQESTELPSAKITFYPTDAKTFTYTISRVYYPVTITLTATKPVVTTSSAFTNIYLTNDGELGNLATERFYEEQASGDGINLNVIDYGKNILNLQRFPIDIPTNIQDEKRPIYLGTKKTTVNSTPLTADVIKLDLGKINVPEQYHNLADYRYTDVVLHLPFTDEINLKPEYVINATIKIMYYVHLYTGKAKLVISSSKNGTVYTSDTINISQKLPFIQLSNDTDYNSMGEAIYTGILQAYVDVISQPPVENATMRVQEHGVLKDYTGYTEASTLNLITSATVSEQQEIQQLLNQGVYIKGKLDNDEARKTNIYNKVQA